MCVYVKYPSLPFNNTEKGEPKSPEKKKEGRMCRYEWTHNKSEQPMLHFTVQKSYLVNWASSHGLQTVICNMFTPDKGHV